MFLSKRNVRSGNRLRRPLGLLSSFSEALCFGVGERWFWLGMGWDAAERDV